jgi:hypothetical protein
MVYYYYADDDYDDYYYVLILGIRMLSSGLVEMVVDVPFRLFFYVYVYPIRIETRILNV